ncbi:MAG: glycosyltransferase [Ruminococcaceae bacterium]|nr:glycosyltransferase [Oscillospiraceae bacterium]
MRVLHLLQSSVFSGAENVICQIIGMFRDEPDIEMVYSSQDGPIRDALVERDITFAPMKKLCFSEVKRVIKEVNPDIIHAHDMRASFYAALLCGKIPMISHMHNNSIDVRGFSLKSLLYAYAARKAKHILWVSESAFGGYYYHDRFAAKSSVLYNVISIDALCEKMNRDTNEYNYDIVYVGRLSYQKNPERFMRIFAEIVKKKPDVNIAVVGSGELKDEAEKLHSELGLGDNVHLLGYCSNPLKMIHDSKAMIMTSRFEGTPMVALEALALGTPIVSTPVDGMCDLIENGKNGYLSDADGEITERLIEIIENSDLRERLSKEAKTDAVQRNDIPTYKEKIMSLYKGV